MSEKAIARLAARRWRVALWLTAAMLAVYFGFILLVAFAKPLMGSPVAGTLTLGILLGVLVIVAAWLVGWPVVLFLIAEPLRNLGKYTFADVVAYRMRQRPVRICAAIGTLATVVFYLIAQMVGAGNLIRLMFGLPYEVAVVGVGVVM